jgi:hypothetical protein
VGVDLRHGGDRGGGRKHEQHERGEERATQHKGTNVEEVTFWRPLFDVRAT